MTKKAAKIISIGVAHKLAQRASNSEDYEGLRDIWEAVDADPSIIGDADDYHNFSVTMSREDDYYTAYQIVARGLEQFPYNTDLLADAIYYGSNCKKYAECNEYVKILLNRPRASWTWRAFTFLIDYFKNCWDWESNIETIEEGLNIALDIAKEYQMYMPSEERSYVAEYELHCSLAKVAMDKHNEEAAQGHMDSALELLKNTIDNGKYAAVQCCLRYADAMFERQAHEEVISICSKALQFGEETASARLGYFMYLSAQSREILLYRNGNLHNEEQVRQVYAEYLAALADTADSYQRNIIKRVKILAARSGFAAPSELIFGDPNY